MPVAEAAPLFVSYAARDRSFAERLSRELRAAGFVVWRDEDVIESGREWSTAVLGALLDASALLVVASPAAEDSAFVRKELSAYVERRGGHIIPVLVESLGARSLGRILGQYQMVDFRGSFEEALPLLLRALPAEARVVGHAPAPSGSASKGYAFISYAEEDSGLVAQLTGFMGRRGYAYWDYQKSDRNYHIQLFLELEEAITRAKAALCVLSPAWRTSLWTVREYLYAGEVGVPTFLLRFGVLPPTLVIAGAHYIDFVADQAKGYERLERELGRKGL